MDKRGRTDILPEVRGKNGELSRMGLTERHWFEDEDVPEKYEWALEDNMYNSRISKKPEDFALTGRGGVIIANRNSVINDLNIAKRILCNPQMLTPETRVRIGQSVTNAINLLTRREQGRWIAVDSLSAFGGDEAAWYAHGNPTAFHYCSECKEQARRDEFGNEILSKYCPDCGTKMDGGQDGELER